MTTSKDARRIAEAAIWRDRSPAQVALLVTLDVGLGDWFQVVRVEPDGDGTVMVTLARRNISKDDRASRMTAPAHRRLLDHGGVG